MRVRWRVVIVSGVILAIALLPSLKAGYALEPHFNATEDSVLNSELMKEAVYKNDFVRNTFYTWTTLEQINDLRSNKILLTKSKSVTRGYSLFDLALRDSTYMNNPIAKMLCEDQFAKKRFAWTNPWATVMGWEGENYGNQLIKIVLKEDAIVGMFDETDTENPFCFYDMKGNKIENADIGKQKEKIAAMYHIGVTRSKRSERQFEGTYMKSDYKAMETMVPYREYVVVNNAMIKFWAYGTDDIITEMNNEIAMLGRVAGNVKNLNYDSKGYSVQLNRKNNNRYWASKTDDGDIHDFYFPCVCFLNDFYLLNKSNMNAIISTLKKCIKAQGQPITGN